MLGFYAVKIFLYESGFRKAGYCLRILLVSTIGTLINISFIDASARGDDQNALNVTRTPLSDKVSEKQIADFSESNTDTKGFFLKISPAASYVNLPEFEFGSQGNILTGSQVPIAYDTDGMGLSVSALARIRLDNMPKWMGRDVSLQFSPEYTFTGIEDEVFTFGTNGNVNFLRIDDPASGRGIFYVGTGVLRLKTDIDHTSVIAPLMLRSKLKIGDHKLDVLAGLEYQYLNQEYDFSMALINVNGKLLTLGEEVVSHYFGPRVGVSGDFALVNGLTLSIAPTLSVGWVHSDFSGKFDNISFGWQSFANDNNDDFYVRGRLEADLNYQITDFTTVGASIESFALSSSPEIRNPNDLTDKPTFLDNGISYGGKAGLFLEMRF